MSGAVPPPAARPLERAARVPRPVCPGCGRCGRGDPAPAPRRAPLRAGVARRGGGGRASPGGAFHRCEGRLVSGAVPPPGRPSSGAGSQGSASRVSSVRSVQAWGPSTGLTACALVGRRCSLWEWQKGVPGGGAFHRCEGRPVSGAVPPLAVRPLERAARVPRPVCPGCGRCGRGDSATAPQRARAGVARCGGGGRTSPGGAPSTIVRGVWCQALSLPRPRVLCSGQPGFRVPGVPGAVGAGVGTQHWSHSACALAGRRCSPWGWRKGVPGGGAFHRCEGRPVSGAVPPPAARPLERAAGVPRPVRPGCGRCGRGGHRPHNVRPCGPALLAVGVAEGRPRGGFFPPLRGAPGVRRCPSPGRPSSGAGSQGSASRVSRVRSVLVWGSSTGPAACALAGQRCSLRGWRKGVPGGGVLSTVVRGAWCQALSLSWSPVLWSGQPGFRVPRVPGAVGAGVGTQHRPHSVRPCGPALLAVGVAEGRPRGGCLPPL